ncbi:MAG: endonuclease/exonuclease/phosphatase family protein [Rhizobiaceae bacterium]|nr:endonuclease/exonuclease/phosphatase family protein [Rhizobiaceae bacterium]
MTQNKSFTVATFNVRNLVNAKTNYYFNKDTGKWKRYSQKAFDQKINWLAEQLYRMNADHVCLQEIFHKAALKKLVKAHADLITARNSSQKPYIEILHAENIDSQTDDPRPGLAFISRSKVLTHETVQDISTNPIEVDGENGFSYKLDRVSRPIQMIEVDLGLGVSGWIFNAHLKSKRPQIDDESDAADEANALFLERTFGIFRSLALRAGEALALRREILNKAKGNDTPIIVVGDLNDETGAVTTEMVAGEAPYRTFDDEVKKLFWDVELHHAARMHLRRSEHSDFYTHIHNGHYGTIDHVFVSQEFYYRAANRIGDVSYVTVFNDHLSDDSIQGAPSNRNASDHAQIVVKIKLDAKRIKAQNASS